jgi:hypothetical protein
MNPGRSFIGVLVAMSIAISAHSHHSFPAEFDIDRPVKLTGRVTKVELINPQSWIHIAVTEEDGSVTVWMIEGGAPNLLFRRGITSTSIPLGSEITLDGWGARDGANRAVGERISFADGTPLFFRGTATPSSAD